MHRKDLSPKEMNDITNTMLFITGTWYRPIAIFFVATGLTMLISRVLLGNPFSVEMALKCASGPLFVIGVALVLKLMYGKPE